MTTQTAESEAARPRLWGPWAFATALAAILLVGFIAVRTGQGVTVNLWDRVSIVVAAEDKYIEVLKLLRGEPDHDRTLAENLLQSEGFYHIGSLDLLDAIHRFDVAEFHRDPELARAGAERMRAALLEMVGSLDGPFETPGTLRQASIEFIRALDDLERAMEEHRQASPLLAEFWRAMTNRESIFRLRQFQAEVEVLAGGEAGAPPKILVCQNNDFMANRDIQLFVMSGEASAALQGYVSARAGKSFRDFPCLSGDPMLPAALAGQPVPLRVNEAAARAIFDPQGLGAAVPRRFAASFLVLPGNVDG